VVVTEEREWLAEFDTAGSGETAIGAMAKDCWICMEVVERIAPRYDSVSDFDNSKGVKHLFYSSTSEEGQDWKLESH
jgi:hypothetical protein